MLITPKGRGLSSNPQGSKKIRIINKHGLLQLSNIITIIIHHVNKIFMSGKHNNRLNRDAKFSKKSQYIKL
jgi:hypothetical protein